MPAVTVNDLNNAKLDCDTIAAITTSTELTAVDRLGQTKRTLAGKDVDINVGAASILSKSTAQAAAALATRTAIDNRYRGALAADPATRTDGSANVTGDEVFNTTSNLLKRWNGTTWQASDLSTANLAAAGGAALVGTDDGKTAQERLGLIQTQSITAGLALRIKGFFRNLAAFSTGGSFGVGDWSDGEAINQHAGDDGTTTRVISVRAETAPLFLGITNRPNGEAGGDVGRSMVSFEGYRLANDVGYRDMGALRIISEGSTVGRYGGRVAILTRPNGVSTVAEFKERFAVHANGDILVGGGVSSANRTGVAGSSVCMTVSGQTTQGVIELTTPAPDASGTTAGELLFVVNQNTGGDKRIARIFAVTTGTTAGNRGGELALQVKTEGGAPIEALRLKSNGDAYVTGGIRTGKPALGSIAQWKLGRAQAVTPTAPNRTIEIEVDGVIYYVAAKTTND